MTGILITRDPVYVGGEWRHIIPIHKFSKSDSGFIRFKTKGNETMAYIPISNIIGFVEEEYIDEMPDIYMDATLPEDSDVSNKN